MNKNGKKVASKRDHSLCRKCGKMACEYFGPTRGWVCAKNCRAKVSYRVRRSHSDCLDCHHGRR